MGNSPIIPAECGRFYRGWPCLLLLGILLGVPAITAGQGGQAIGDALALCAALTDNDERLDCFDRVASGDDATPSVETTDLLPVRESNTSDVPVEPGNASNVGIDNNMDPAAPPADSASISNIESVHRTEAAPMTTPTPRTNAPTTSKESAKVPAAVATPAPKVVRAAAPVELGDRSVGAVAEVPVEPSELTASVERIARQPRGEYIVFLDNEQVWVQEFKDSYFPLEVGDAVTIKKRRFGGYRLLTESGKAYQVKRLR